jgi:hypothetical protein
MKRFAYAFDPVCVVASTAYACNRWVVPAALKGIFLRGYFSDLLFLPAALPPMLWLQRRLRLRDVDSPPAWSELVLHWAVWSVAAELVAPHLFARATGDPWDVVAYAIGGMIAACFWQRE